MVDGVKREKQGTSKEQLNRFVTGKGKRTKVGRKRAATAPVKYGGEASRCEVAEVGDSGILDEG
jgi:hypothetical protein